MGRRAIKSILRRFGYDVVRYTPANFARLRRLELLRASRVNVVLDVGANVGQFAREIREDGFDGRIISFEPLAAAFEVLVTQTDGHRWQCLNVALGAKDGEASLNVSHDTWSSSLLPPTERLVAAAPGAATASTQVVAVRMLDSLRDAIAAPDDVLFLKIDAQGSEREILAGSRVTLTQVSVLELELSLVPLYEEQPPLAEVLDMVEALGFRLASLANGFADLESHELLQVDAVFVRRDA